MNEMKAIEFEMLQVCMYEMFNVYYFTNRKK